MDNSEILRIIKVAMIYKAVQQKTETSQLGARKSVLKYLDRMQVREEAKERQALGRFKKIQRQFISSQKMGYCRFFMPNSVIFDDA